MICKKGDFGGVKDRGVSLKNRKIIFYLVCVPLRLGIAYTAYLIQVILFLYKALIIL